MRTKQLYYEDEYMKEFSAVVLKVEKQENYYYTLLNQTAFFPEGGGQTGDKGWLNGKQVIDTKEIDGEIFHIMKEEIPAGSQVEGKIDFSDRFDKMQQHSAEHMVSGLVHRLYQYNNVGFHLGETETRIDFDGELTKKQIENIEFLVNQAVYENIPIEILYPAKDELGLFDYRSKIEIEGQVRLVKIPGIDLCACCAPHVRNTGEIGMIKILSYERFRGGCRMTMAAGMRALRDYQKKQDGMADVSRLLSANSDNIAELVKNLKKQHEDMRRQLNEVQERYLTEKIQNITPDQKQVFLFEEIVDMIAARNFVNEAMNVCNGICAAFIGNDRDGYHYIIGSGVMDVRPIAKKFNEAFSGRGGGKPQMVQGSVRGTRKQIEAWTWMDN